MRGLTDENVFILYIHLPIFSPLFQTIRMIENNLDKAKIKHDMAIKIQRNYIEILQCLEEVCLFCFVVLGRSSLIKLYFLTVYFKAHCSLFDQNAKYVKDVICLFASFALS